MAKRRAKSDDNKKLIFKIAILLLAVYLVYSSISMQSQLALLNRELKEKQVELNEYNSSKDELKRLINEGSMDELIERAAREKLDFVYHNEEIYKDISGK